MSCSREAPLKFKSASKKRDEKKNMTKKEQEDQKALEKQQKKDDEEYVKKTHQAIAEFDKDEAMGGGDGGNYTFKKR